MNQYPILEYKIFEEIKKIIGKLNFNSSSNNTEIPIDRVKIFKDMDDKYKILKRTVKKVA